MNSTPRSLVILGSTGSIGRSTLEVVSLHAGRFRLAGLASYSSDQLLAEQYRTYRPSMLCMVDRAAAGRLRSHLAGESVTILEGEEGLLDLTALSGVDMVVNAIVGAAGLRASLKTVSQGKLLALANKESLVAGGPLFADLIARHNSRILPIDSEHSAIWQGMQAGRPGEVRRVILTSSGGPFRQTPAEQLADVTLEEALSHPTWKMGPKISIDSATLANKGLEVIEAIQLFGLKLSQVSVVIHPQSIVHSLVEFVDSSQIAQLSRPDMRLPIQYALCWPDRFESPFGRLDFAEQVQLTFEPPDPARFRMLPLASAAATAGGTAPAIYNAANETAVAAFLERSIRFTDIAEITERVLNSLPISPVQELEDVLFADREARSAAASIMEKVA